MFGTKKNYIVAEAEYQEGEGEEEDEQEGEGTIYMKFDNHKVFEEKIVVLRR